MNIRRANHLLPIAALAVGFAVGAWLVQRRAPAAAAMENRSAQQATSRPSDIPAAFSAGEMLKTIASVLDEEATLRQAHRFHELLVPLGSDEIRTLFEHALKMKDSEKRQVVLLRELLARWLQIDPAAAAVAVKPYNDRLQASVTFIWGGVDGYNVSRAWAQAAPEAALAEAMANPRTEWARTFGPEALEALTDRDLAALPEILARFPQSSLRADLCKRMINTLAEQNTQAAERAIDLLPTEMQRLSMRTTILGKLAERDPGAALARLEAISENLTTSRAAQQLVTEVIRAAAGKDAPAALALAQKLAGTLRDRAIGSALVGWAGQNPAEALAWAAANGVDVGTAKATVNDTYGAAWQTLLTVAMYKDLSATLAWLHAQSPSPARDRMFRDAMPNCPLERRTELFAAISEQGQASAASSMAQNLAWQSPKAIAEWVRSLPEGSARAAAVEKLVRSTTDKSDAKPDSIAAAWPAGLDRDHAMAGAASGLVYDYPERAVEFARRITDSELQQIAYEDIARTWLWRDTAKARVWMENFPDLSADTKRVLIRQYEAGRF